MPCVGQNKIVYNTQELPSIDNLSVGDKFIIDTLDGPYKVDYKNFIFDISQTTFSGIFKKHTTDITDLVSSASQENLTQRYDDFQRLAGEGLVYISSIQTQLSSIVESLSSTYYNLKERYSSVV
jgi:hypothetical protein